MLRLKTRITLTGDWVVVRGFRFEHCYQQAVHIKGGSHNRITQCQFFHCGSPHSTFGHILRVDMESHRNRVDHCYWTGSKCMSLGQRNDTRRPEAVGKHNRYDHNGPCFAVPMVEVRLKPAHRASGGLSTECQYRPRLKRKSREVLRIWRD